MKILVVLCISLLFPSFALSAEPNMVNFLKHARESMSLIEDKSEALIVKSYLNYLEAPTEVNAQAVIEKLEKKVLKDKKILNSKWLSLFEGDSTFCIGKMPNVGEYCLSHATDKIFIPLIEKGDRSAITLLLVYSAAVNSDGADAEYLMTMQMLVKSKYPDEVKRVQRSHSKFFKKFPIIWWDRKS